jgi:hypothetical protein
MKGVSSGTLGRIFFADFLEAAEKLTIGDVAATLGRHKHNALNTHMAG